MVNLKARRGREKHQKIVLEGKRLIYDAVNSGCFPELVFFTRASDLDDLNLPEETKIYRVPYKSCQLWGDVSAHQGIIVHPGFILRCKFTQQYTWWMNPYLYTLIGNIVSRKVNLLKSGIFDIPNLKNQEAANCLPLTIICDNIRDPGNLGAILRICAAVECEKLILVKGCTSIWDPKVLRAAAGAHFHFAAQENVHWDDIQDEVSKHSSVFLSDTFDTLKDEGAKYPFGKKSNICKELQLTSYLSAEFSNRGTAIVIGGESHGLSEEAYKFAQERNGTRIYIPLGNNIDSLNSSMALAVLAFEFKRQLHLKYFSKNIFSI